MNIEQTKQEILEEFDDKYGRFWFSHEVDKKCRDILINELSQSLNKLQSAMLDDMKITMAEWHGRGKAMIDDYERQAINQAKEQLSK